MGYQHKEQLPEAEPQWALSCEEAVAAQLIELDRPGPATRGSPLSALPPVPGRRRHSGAEGLIEGRRYCRLSPCPRQPLPPEIIPLFLGLRVALASGIPNWTVTL